MFEIIDKWINVLCKGWFLLDGSNMFRMTSELIWNNFLLTKSSCHTNLHNFSSGFWILSSGSRQQNRFQKNIHFVDKESLLTVQHLITETAASVAGAFRQLKWKWSSAKQTSSDLRRDWIKFDVWNHCRSFAMPQLGQIHLGSALTAVAQRLH